MKVIDLTLPIKDILQPDDQAKQHGITMSWLHIHSHAGTHMDAPLHFLPSGHSMETMPLEKCVGPAIVVDMTHKEWNSIITVDDLLPYADQIGQGSRVLIRTDWDQHYGQEHYESMFPRIGVDSAEWLAARGIVLIGVEHPSVAALNSIEELTAVHHAFLKHNIVIVEGLAGLRHLPARVTFVALPLKLVGGDGTPTRAVALIDD